MVEKLQIIRRLKKEIKKNSFPFPFNIWKIEVDHNGYLAIEIREEETMEITVEVLSLRTLKRCNAIVLEEAWWWKMSGFQYPYVVFQQFHDPDSIEHTSIMVLDVVENTAVWELDNSGIKEIAVDAIRVKEGELYQWRNIATGAAYPIENIEVLDTMPLQLPFQYSEGETHFDSVASFLKNKRNVAPCKMIEYFENDSGIIISYYLYNQNKKLDQHLSIFSVSGQLLEEKVIGVDLEGVGVDSFFIMEERVISICNKSELIIYEIF